MEAVRDKPAVTARSMTADEFSIPFSVTNWLVVCATVPSSARISVNEIQGMSPPQYSGTLRLGVCPLASRATSIKGNHRQPFGIEVSSGDTVTGGELVRQPNML